MAVASVRALVRAYAPELASVTDAAIDLRCDVAEAMTSARVFGAYYTIALAYLTAHLLTVDLRASGGPSGGGGGSAGVGPVTAERVGDLSTSYGSIGWTPRSAADADLTATSYGLRWLALRDTRAGVLPIVVG